MAAVHEEMHQGAGEEQKPGENAVEMGTMFGHQVKSGDGQEPDQDDVRRRGKEASPRAVVTIVSHLDIPPCVAATICLENYYLEAMA